MTNTVIFKTIELTANPTKNRMTPDNAANSCLNVSELIQELIVLSLRASVIELLESIRSLIPPQTYVNLAHFRPKVKQTEPISNDILRALVEMDARKIPVSE
jgi:hypothetical protein